MSLEFKNSPYTAPGQPGGGPRLYQGARPPGPTLATALSREFIESCTRTLYLILTEILISYFVKIQD